VQFVVIDLDQKLSAAQKQIKRQYFQGAIPHVVVLDRSGKAVYDSVGEVGEDRIATILNRALK
jgi:hypothetical protein